MVTTATTELPGWKRPKRRHSLHLCRTLKPGVACIGRFDQPQVMSTDQIDGWDALEEWFGFSPNFHDAEVISLDLRREPEPSIIRVHAWRTNSDLDAKGYYRTDRHAIVSFEITGISEMHLDGWNHQNVLYEMWVTSAEEGFEVHMPTSHGMEGKLVAKSVRVSLEPHNAP